MISTAITSAACALAVLLSVLAAPVLAGQSTNHGLTVTPAPKEVRIDGDLADWDWSGRIWLFADKMLASRYSTEIAAMWDAEYLYLAAHYKDPTPLFNQIDPAFNPNDGWKSDAIQVRILTDRPVWLTAWYYTGGNKPVLRLDYWKDPKNVRAGQDGVVYFNRGDGDPTDVGGGARLAYKADADGKGYVQETRIPWSLLYRQVPEIKAGLVLRSGFEVIWGDPTGKVFPSHRYADNLQPGNTSREFFWSNIEGWGDATLSPVGQVPIRRYTEDSDRIAGSIPIRVAVPASAARFTVVIEDKDGRRLRNLGADLLPDDYRINGDKQQPAEIKWDGLDDAGQLVAPGEYRVRALAHDGLGAEYEMCFYNPGTPPWSVPSGRGNWGADHSPPSLVATAGDSTVIGWPFAEGGSGLISVGPDGLKQWGEKRGASALAADEEYVYAITNSWHDAGKLCRFGRKDGSYKPFEIDGKARPFEVDLSDLLPGVVAATGVIKPSDHQSTRPPVNAMAVSGGKLILALANGKIAILNAKTAQSLKVLEFPEVTAIATAPDGSCYGVVDGQIQKVGLQAGTLAKMNVAGLHKAGAIAADQDGNIAAFDLGPDQQVKVYSPGGKLLRTAGQQGGRPIRGRLNREAMSNVSSITFDQKGQLWAVESWNYPRRVAVWGGDGKLVRQYIGNTGYAGVNSYFHDTDPTIAAVGPVELKLDRRLGTWDVTRVLWVPDEAKGERFGMDVISNHNPQRFTSDASGTPREYLYAHDTIDGSGHVFYMEHKDGWRPVSAVCLGGHVSGKINHDGTVAQLPEGEFADLGAYDLVFWNDANDDGKPQRSECEIKRSANPGTVGHRGVPPVRLSNGWGGRVGRDLVFYTDGLTQFRPVRFCSHGAPVFGPAGMTELPLKDNGDLVPVPEEKLLLLLSNKGYPKATTGLVGLNPATGRVKWTYPNLYPGVHGSHAAPMPKPGLMVGPLKILGVAEVGGSVGRVLAVRGNLGQDYFFTTDGFFVGAMFNDGRLPADSLPETEKQLKGMPMEGFSNGAEPFNGWFGRQADGHIRVLTGFPREAAMSLRVKGLESIVRLPAQSLTVDAAILARATAENAARASTALGAKRYAVRRLSDKVAIDGKPGEWSGLEAAKLSREGMPQKGTAKLTYDDKNLYVLFEIEDPSPMLNEGKDFTRLFKTGDAVDLQIGTDPRADLRRANPAAGDLRVVISRLNGKPAAVLMRPIDKTVGGEARVNYHSPVGDRLFDLVRVLEDAEVKIEATGQGYCVEASIPLASLGLSPKAGLKLRGDLGFISSDMSGRHNTARTYWSNQDTNLVSDLPLEAWFSPEKWSDLIFE